MAIQKTPVELITLIRTKYKLPATTGNSWPQDADLRVLLGQAIENYHEMTMSAGDNRKLERLGNFNLLASAIALPPDYIKLVDGPFLSDDGQTWTRPRQLARGFEAQLPGSGPSWPLFYQESDGYLVFAPEPLVSPMMLKYRYVVGRVVDLDTTAPIDGPFGWADYVTTWTCRELAIADGIDPSIWFGRLESSRKVLQRALSSTDGAAVMQVQDTRFEDDMPLGDVERYEYLRNGPWYRRY